MNLVAITGDSTTNLSEITFASIVNVDVVIVMVVNAGDLRSVMVEGSGHDGSGSLWKLGTSLLFSSACVPCEEDWAFSVLSSDGS